MKLILKKDITNVNVLDNLLHRNALHSILIDEDGFWIEITNYQGYAVPDGKRGYHTLSFEQAYNKYLSFKKENL